MTSGDPGLATPSKMFSSEGGVLHLQMCMEMCISIAGLWQRDCDLFIDEQAAVKEGHQALSKGDQMQFFLRHRKYLLILLSRATYCWDEVWAVHFNPHWDMTGERSTSSTTDSLWKCSQTPQCLYRHMVGHTNTHTQSTGKFWSISPHEDMQDFQTLSSLKLELRPHPKSTKRLFTGSRC